MGRESKQKAPTVGQLIQIECEASRLSQFYGQMKPRNLRINVWKLFGWNHRGPPESFEDFHFRHHLLTS